MKEFKGIAMKCSQKNWEEIKPILEKNNLCIENITTFNDCTYLVNNYELRERVISNASHKSDYHKQRTVFEEWDMNTFLEYCGIEVEFVLPDKWCVKVIEENCNILGKFYAITSFKSYRRIIPDKYIGKYMTSHNVSSKNSIFSEIPGSNFDIKAPNDLFKEISFGQFKKYVLKEQEKILPQYFVIKREENNPLWDKYISWLNKTYNQNYYGTRNAYYGFDNNDYWHSNGTNFHNCIKEFKNNPELITLEFWNECINQQTQNKTEIKMTQKLTVKVTEVLKIHEIACSDWKSKIAGYLSRVDKDQNITFTQKEVDEMFKAATEEQLPTLESIFGKKVAEIDYSKLKTGSKVMIKRTGKHCNGISNIDLSKPVDIVFYKTPYTISYDNDFKAMGPYNSYITFHQNKKFVVFAADNHIDYITEVIEY